MRGTTMELFKGVCTALVTPFRDGKIDYRTLKKLVEYQANQGADAVVVCGTTGESPTMTALEKLRCVSAAVEAADGKIPVIAGTGTNDTEYSAKLSKSAAKEGADAILAVAPYYNKPTQQGMVRHFLKVAESCGKPLIVYNIPSRTGCDIADSTYKELAESGAVCGIKEASGSVSRAQELIMKFGDKLDLYSGNDDLTLPLLAVGAKGVISVVSNLFPTEMHAMCELWSDGKYREALELNRSLMPLMKALFTETNPIPVKAAMEQLGFCTSEMRLPLTPAREETRKAVGEAMKQLI